MEISICGVGGYNEVGKNMTAVKIGEDAFIFDMGFNVQKLVDLEEEGTKRQFMSAKQLINLDAVPNDSFIESWKSKVKAICISHCHLDHLAAVPYLSNHYNAPILSRPYTNEVLKNMLVDDNLKINNEIKDIATNKPYKINEEISIEFIDITHSTPHTSFIAVHTKKGIILYANDFKFDNHPVIGQKFNYEKLKELKDEGVYAVFVDSLYSTLDRKTPSELVAREMLEEVLLDTKNQENAIIATCFSSHIARLKSILDFSKKMNRQAVFLGRSLMKYSLAAQKVGIYDFTNEAEIIGYGDKVKRKLRHFSKKNTKDYIFVVTGGQGEPNSILSRIVRGDLNFKFKKEDNVIFSNRIVPVEPNIKNRLNIEKKLKDIGCRVFKDVHVSGHCSKEDIRDLINLIEPEHIIPVHGGKLHVEPAVKLAEEMGYKRGKDVHVLRDGMKLKI